jgi:hypothetical protein
MERLVGNGKLEKMVSFFLFKRNKKLKDPNRLYFAAEKCTCCIKTAIDRQSAHRHTGVG